MQTHEAIPAPRTTYVSQTEANSRMKISRRAANRGLAGLAGVTALGRLSNIAQARERSAEVVQIADGVFVHAGQIALQTPDNHADISNSGFIIGDDGVAVVDTSGSYLAGEALRAAIVQHTSKPIKYVINTHMHLDHVLGNATFKQDKPRYVAHHKMARALSLRGERYLQTTKEALGAEAFAGTEIVLPDTGVEASEKIDLGGRSLRLDAQQTAHTDNDLIVRDDKTGAAFVGDLIFSRHVPSLDGSIVGWIEVLEKLEELSSGKIVPGHGPEAISWHEGSSAMLRYLRLVATDVRAIIKRGGTISEAVETAAVSEAAHWQMFDEFHKRNVTAAFAELEWE